MAATSHGAAPALLRAPDGRVFAERAAYVRHCELLCRLTDAVDHKFVRLPGEVASQSFDVLRLRGCEVVVLDAVAAVSVEDCDSCRFFIGPCAGAVVVRNCRNCIFTLVSNHLRVKSSTGCIFSAFLQNGPAIEASTTLTLGPLNGTYAQLQQHARAAGLAAIHESNNRVFEVVDFSEGSAELGDGPHWLPLDPTEWDWDQVHEDEAARRGPLTPVAILTTAALLDRFDTDGDSAWTFAELNAYQAATGDEDRVADAADMASMLAAAGVPLDSQGLLRLHGLLTLYGAQGPDALARDIGAIGLEDIGPGRVPVWSPKVPPSSSLQERSAANAARGSGPARRTAAAAAGAIKPAASLVLSQLNPLPNIARAQIAVLTGGIDEAAAAAAAATASSTADVPPGEPGAPPQPPLQLSAAGFQAQSLLYVAGASFSPRKVAASGSGRSVSHAGSVVSSSPFPPRLPVRGAAPSPFGDDASDAQAGTPAPAAPRFMRGRLPELQQQPLPDSSSVEAAPALAALARACAGRAGVDVVAWISNREADPETPTGAVAAPELARALHDLAAGLRLAPPPLADLEDECAALAAPGSAFAAAPSPLAEEPQVRYRDFLSAASAAATAPPPPAAVLAASTAPNARRAPSAAGARPPVHPLSKTAPARPPRGDVQRQRSLDGAASGSPASAASHPCEGDDDTEGRQQQQQQQRDRAASSMASYTHAGAEAAHVLEALLLQRASEQLRAAATAAKGESGGGGGQFLTGSLRPALPAALGVATPSAARRPSSGGSSVLSSRSSVLEHHENARGAAPAAFEARGRSSSPGRAARAGGARAALQTASAVHSGRQQQPGASGPARLPPHERARQRHAQRALLLQAGDCDGLASMLLEDLADAVQRAPDLFSRLRRAVRAAPGYEVARDAREPAEAAAGGEDRLFLLAPTVARLLAECADLRWPLPVVAVALLRVGGKVVIPQQQQQQEDVGSRDPATPLDLVTDYSRVVVSKQDFDRALTAFRLTGLSSRAVPAKKWAASKAVGSRALLDASIRHYKAALASSTQGVPAAGTPEAGAWLTREQVDELTEAFDTVPETWAATEAAAQAEAWLTTKEGRRAIAEEQAKLHAAAAAAGGRAPTATTASRTASYDAAALRVLAARTEAGVAAFASDSSKAAALFWAYVADARAGRWPSGTSEVLNDAALGPLPETPGSAHYPTGFEAWLRWREAVRRRKARSLARWRRAKNAERGAALAAGASAVPLAVAERVVVELASRAQTEVEESGGTIKAVHPSRKGLDIAVRLARLREAASSTPVPTPTKATSADPSRRTQRAATGDGASSEGYSADFASESAGEPPSDTKNAAAAVAAIAPPQIVSRAQFESIIGPALFSLAADKTTGKTALALHDARGTAKRHVDAALAGDAAAASAETDRLLRRLAQLEQERREQLLKSAPKSPVAATAASKDPVSGGGRGAEADAAEEGAGAAVAPSPPSVVRVVDAADVRADALNLLVDEEAARLAARYIPAALEFVDPAAAAAASSAEKLSKQQLAAQRFEEWRKRKAEESRAVSAQRAAEAEKKAARARELRAKSAKAFRDWMRDAKARYGFAKGSAGPPAHDGRLDSYAHAQLSSTSLLSAAPDDSRRSDSRLGSPHRTTAGGAESVAVGASTGSAPRPTLQSAAAADQSHSGAVAELTHESTLNFGAGSGQVLAARSPQSAPRGGPAALVDASRSSFLAEEMEGFPPPPPGFAHAQRFSGPLVREQQQRHMQPGQAQLPPRKAASAGPSQRSRSDGRGNSVDARRQQAARPARPPSSSYPHPRPWVGIEYEPEAVPTSAASALESSAPETDPPYGREGSSGAGTHQSGGGSELWHESPQRRRYDAAPGPRLPGSGPVRSRGFPEDEDAGDDARLSEGLDYLAGTQGRPPSPSDFESSRDYGRALQEAKGPRGTSLAGSRPAFVVRAPASQPTSPTSAARRNEWRAQALGPRSGGPQPPPALARPSSSRPTTPAISFGRDGGGRAMLAYSSLGSGRVPLRPASATASRGRDTMIQAPVERKPARRSVRISATTAQRAAPAAYAGVRPATVSTYSRSRPGHAAGSASGARGAPAAAATRPQRTQSRGRPLSGTARPATAPAARSASAAPPASQQGRGSGNSRASGVKGRAGPAAPLGAGGPRPFKGFEAEIVNRTAESDFYLPQQQPASVSRVSGCGGGDSPQRTSLTGDAGASERRRPISVGAGGGVNSLFGTAGGVKAEVASAMAAVEELRRRRLGVGR